MAQDKDEKDTIERVMHAFKEGELKSGGGKPVRKREQAIAIALNEARESEGERDDGKQGRRARTRK